MAFIFIYYINFISFIYTYCIYISTGSWSSSLSCEQIKLIQFKIVENGKQVPAATETITFEPKIDDIDSDETEDRYDYLLMEINVKYNYIVFCRNNFEEKCGCELDSTILKDAPFRIAFSYRFLNAKHQKMHPWFGLVRLQKDMLTKEN